MGGARQADIGGIERRGGILNLTRLALAGVSFWMGCEVITANFDRIIAIEIDSPSQVTIAVGDTLQLSASAINAAGDPVPDAVIVWAVLDVDSGQVGFTLNTETGTVIGVSPGSGRVRAQVENLPSDPITITVMMADTTATGIRTDPPLRGLAGGP